MNSQLAPRNTLGTSQLQRLRLQLMAAEHVARIGARIRNRREELDLSRKKLAAKMDGVVSENDIYRWEKGRHRPEDNTLQEIARALDVPVSHFLIDEPKAGSPDLLNALTGDDQEGISGRLDRIEAAIADLAEAQRSSLQKLLEQGEPPRRRLNKDEPPPEEGGEEEAS